MADIQNAINVIKAHMNKTTDPAETEAFETAVAAMEKCLAKPIRPVAGAVGEKYECPECGSSLSDMDLLAGHCKWCGQAIEEQ